MPDSPIPTSPGSLFLSSIFSSRFLVIYSYCTSCLIIVELNANTLYKNGRDSIFFWRRVQDGEVTLTLPGPGFQVWEG